MFVDVPSLFRVGPFDCDSVFAIEVVLVGIGDDSSLELSCTVDTGVGNKVVAVGYLDIDGVAGRIETIVGCVDTGVAVTVGCIVVIDTGFGVIGYMDIGLSEVPTHMLPLLGMTVTLGLISEFEGFDWIGDVLVVKVS